MNFYLWGVQSQMPAREHGKTWTVMYSLWVWVEATNPKCGKSHAVEHVSQNRWNPTLLCQTSVTARPPGATSEWRINNLPSCNISSRFTYRCDWQQHKTCHREIHLLLRLMWRGEAWRPAAVVSLQPRFTGVHSSATVSWRIHDFLQKGGILQGTAVRREGRGFTGELWWMCWSCTSTEVGGGFCE